MKKHDDAYEQLIAKALFDTPTDEERRVLEAHLAECDACAEEVQSLRRVLDVTATRVRPEPPAAFWEGFEDRLAERIRVEERRRGWKSYLNLWHQRVAGLAAALVPPVPRWTLQLAVAVVLVGVGILLGRAFFGAPATEPPPVAVAEDPPAVDEEPIEEAPPPAQDEEAAEVEPAPRTPRVDPPASRAPEPAQFQPAALETRTRDYIDRSKVLLLGLVNFDTAQGDPAVLNLARKRDIARRLVDEAEGLKDDLSAANEQRLRELIADLEFILLQIANLEAEHDVPAIELVQSGVDRKAILLKINVEEMRMGALDDVPSAADAPPSI